MVSVFIFSGCWGGLKGDAVGKGFGDLFGCSEIFNPIAKGCADGGRIVVLRFAWAAGELWECMPETGADGFLSGHGV